MRIVFLSYNYSPDIHSPQEWIERIKFYVGWSEYLARGHTVIRVDHINYEGNFTHNRIKYHFVNEGQKINYFPEKLHLYVKELRPDVVIVSSFLFPVQLVQLRNTLGKDVKIIIQHHAERPYTGIKKYIQRFASHKADIFLFTSYAIGADWVKKGNISTETKIRELMEVSSVFYSLDKNNAREKTKAFGSPLFIWVGRLNQNKDPLTAVRGFLKFSAFQPDARLYMFYHTAELVSEIKKLLPLKPAISPVILMGKIHHNELLHWYNSADFYLSASHYEGSGTALCESLSCGCIPIVTEIPSFRTISGNCGLLYKPGDEEALIWALQQAANLNTEEEKIKVLKHFKNELSFEAIAVRFQTILNSL